MTGMPTTANTEPIAILQKAFLSVECNVCVCCGVSPTLHNSPCRRRPFSNDTVQQVGHNLSIHLHNVGNANDESVVLSVINVALEQRKRHSVEDGRQNSRQQHNAHSGATAIEQSKSKTNSTNNVCGQVETRERNCALKSGHDERKQKDNEIEQGEKKSTEMNTVMIKLRKMFIC